MGRGSVVAARDATSLHETGGSRLGRVGEIGALHAIRPHEFEHCRGVGVPRVILASRPFGLGLRHHIDEVAAPEI